MTDDKARPAAAGSTPLTGISTVDEHGDQPMTSAQADELRALSERHGVAFDQTLSRDAAAQRIAELKGQDGGVAPPREH